MSWIIQIGDDPLNLVAALNCPMVMAAVQAALMTAGMPGGQALDLAEEAWGTVEKGYGAWHLQMGNGELLTVYCAPAYRSAEK